MKFHLLSSDLVFLCQAELISSFRALSSIGCASTEQTHCLTFTNDAHRVGPLQTDRDIGQNLHVSRVAAKRSSAGFCFKAPLNVGLHHSYVKNHINDCPGTFLVQFQVIRSGR